MKPQIVIFIIVEAVISNLIFSILIIRVKGVLEPYLMDFVKVGILLKCSSVGIFVIPFGLVNAPAKSCFLMPLVVSSYVLSHVFFICIIVSLLVRRKTFTIIEVA